MLLEQKRCKELLLQYGFDLPQQYVFKNYSELKGHGHVLKKIKFPVALKVDSQNIIHKSDKGYVIIDIKDKKELKNKTKELKDRLQRNNIEEYHFLIQEMIMGTEFIIGMKRDEIFGPVILFGVGGIFVEVLKDISLRIAPLNKRDCKAMINEIKSKKIIEGYRSYPKIPENLLINILMKISEMVIKEKDIEEIDFNPVIANEQQAKVVDARIIMK